MELQSIQRNPLIDTMESSSIAMMQEESVRDECIREISRREANEMAVSRLFGTAKSIVVDKSSIYQRGQHGKKLMIGNMFNPLHDRMKYILKMIAIVGYTHSYYTAYDVAFGPLRESPWLLAIDQIVNAMFIGETILQCRTALYLASSDVFVADPTFIRRRFASIKILPRLLHIAPLELIHFIFVPAHISYSGGLGLRLLRLFKLIRLKQLFITSETTTAHYIERNRWMMLFEILARFACVSHMIACVLYGLSLLDDNTSNLSFFGRLCTNWGLDTGCQLDQSASWLYISCLYYAVTITTTIGFGNIFPYTNVQLVAHVCFIIIGSLHNAIIIAKVVETIEEFSRVQREYAHALSRLNDFTETRNISEGLRQELKRHFDYQWSRSRCIDEREFLNETSETLRLQISHALYFTTVRHAKLFNDVPDPFIVALMLNSTARFIRKNECVFTVGSLASSMFVVLKGTLQEYKDTTMKEPISLFEKSDCFGLEIFGKDGLVRTTMVRAETNSDIFLIEQETLIQASKLYSNVYESLHLKALNQLNQRLNTSLGGVPQIG